MSEEEGGSTSKIESKPIEESSIIVGKIIMSYVKVGGYKFDIEKFDGRSDYVLWERQVKGVLKASGLGKVLRPKPEKINEEDWRDIQEQVVSTVIKYVQPSVLKQLGEHKSCEDLFKKLSKQYHYKELSNHLLASLKWMSFKMKDTNTKIQDYIDAFNNLVVNLINLGEDLSDERKALHLLISLSSFQSLTRVLIHGDKKTITYNQVISALVIDDLQSKLMALSQPTSSSNTTLYVTRGRSLEQGNKNDGKNGGSKGRFKSKSRSWDRKTITCWNYGKKCHMKRDCKSKAKTSDPPQANVTFASLD
jgi:hypothetical protein